MTTTIERHPRPADPTIALPSVDLEVGHEIALFVDTLHLGSRNVMVSLQLKPSSENPDAKNLLVCGTPAQLSAFENTLDYYQQATVDGLYDERLRTAVSTNSLLPTEKKVA